MIQELTVLSGKGGTGKTSITAALGSFAKKAIFTDCDVDAADLHLLFSPNILETYNFEGGVKAEINETACSGCGICYNACRFDAIRPTGNGLFEIDPLHCEGCRLCERICPESAITSIRSMNNQWFVSDTRFGPMVHARMGPGEENSGKLVTTVREKAREIARDKKYNVIINDGPPGIGCPVIASLAGIHKILLVAESSESGYQDLLRILELISNYDAEVFGIINKFDINPGISEKIESALTSNNITITGKIPFDREFVEAMVQGKTISELSPGSKAVNIIENTWYMIASSIKKQA